MLTKEQENTLASARQIYGSRNQLAVAAEECNELAIAVLKFMRYADEKEGIEATKKSVLEERADVEIILNHIDAIYGLSPEMVRGAMFCKIARLQRWLDKTNSMEYTMVDREVDDSHLNKSCEGCFYYDPNTGEIVETGACVTCKNRRD